jgi:GntR family transcriptional regulator
VVEFHVDRGSGLPAYLQLSRQVREAMRLGWLQPGDRLPTVRDVVASSGVNANTELAGLVEARQGSGTFVKASLGSAAPEDLDPLRVKLADWVAEARSAGLEEEDIDALVREVLSGGAR